MKWLEGVVCTLEDISIENEYDLNINLESA